jgi:hypothetical protein
MKIGDKVKITATQWWNQGFHGKIGQIISKNDDDTWIVMFNEYVDTVGLGIVSINQCEFSKEEMQVV